MTILIQLSLADVECLLRHLPTASDLSRKLGSSDRTAISNIRPVGSSNAIDCSEHQARELLRIANEHCSAAVEKIQRGMRMSGVTF